MKRWTLFFLFTLCLAGATLVYGLGWTTAGARVAVRAVAARYAEAAEVTVGPIRGTLASGVAIERLRATRLRALPEGSSLDIQRLDLAGVPAWLLRRRGLTVSVFNGRLRLPESEPIVFSGETRGGALDARLYVSRVGVRGLFAMFAPQVDAGRFSGAITDLGAHLTGTWREPALDGEFRLERLSRDAFSLSGCPGSFALRLQELGPRPQLHGEVVLRGGTVAARRTTIALHTSRIIFAGNPRRPSFDLEGTTTISRTHITAALTGTLGQPVLRLSSDPPLSERQLLIMLTTGKGWKGAERSLDQGRLSSDLAADFVDYFVFGGLGSRLSQRLGISNLALQYDPEERRVGFTTGFADTLAFSYEMDPTRGSESAEPRAEESPDALPAFKVGAEYRVTDDTSLQLEGEREPGQPRAGSAEAAPPDGAGAAPTTQDEVWLKIKRRF